MSWSRSRDWTSEQRRLFWRGMAMLAAAEIIGFAVLIYFLSGAA